MMRKNEEMAVPAEERRSIRFDPHDWESSAQLGKGGRRRGGEGKGGRRERGEVCVHGDQGGTYRGEETRYEVEGDTNGHYA